MIFFLKRLSLNVARSYCHSSKIHQELIERYTKISTAHLTPEIKLNLIESDIESNENIAIAEPFWGFYWPGGQGVARYILDNPSIIKGKKVLDFGCGSGALAIAALKAGAIRVVANDIDPIAITASVLNAQLNSVSLEVSSENMIGKDCELFDVVLVGDMLYDSVLSESIANWLIQLAKSEKTILIGDPGRAVVNSNSNPFASTFCHVAKYELDIASKKENNGLNQASVFRLL